MANIEKTDDSDWEEVWDARAEALSQVLGPGHDQVYHAAHPFALGGQADVLAFFHHVPGVVYITAELTGKPNACYANYELMICHRAHSDWGANVISRLAPYTQHATIRAGESMDIDGVAPGNSLIKAFVFDTYGTFALFEQQCELRLCIGITTAELQFKLERGAQELLTRLKTSGVYPYTDLHRQSIPLED
jgi:hypothetical protein